METNIVNYLRARGIEPVVTVKSIGDENPSSNVINEYHPIDYDKPYDYYYNSLYNESGQWWQIDLKRLFYIGSYNLIAGSECNFVRQWELTISQDPKNGWESVDPHSGISTNQPINFEQYHLARYARITGSAPGCGYADRLAFQRIFFYGIQYFSKQSYQISSCRKGTVSLFLINILH